MKKNSHLIKIVMTALLASLCTVATMVIQIPTPTGGFLNLGDAVVILCGFLLGPVYGALAAGIGSALADIFAGYVQYAPATFFIKAAMALCVWLILQLLRKSTEKNKALSIAATVAGGVCAEIIMVGGYFFFEAVILRYGIGAAVSIIPNAVQGVAGIIAGTLLTEIMKRTRIKEKLM